VDEYGFEFTLCVIALKYVSQHSTLWTIQQLLLSSGFTFVCRFASHKSFPISCYNSSPTANSIFKTLWHFKIPKKIGEFFKQI